MWIWGSAGVSWSSPTAPEQRLRGLLAIMTAWVVRGSSCLFCFWLGVPELFVVLSVLCPSFLPSLLSFFLPSFLPSFLLFFISSFVTFFPFFLSSFLPFFPSFVLYLCWLSCVSFLFCYVLLFLCFSVLFCSFFAFLAFPFFFMFYYCVSYFFISFFFHYFFLSFVFFLPLSLSLQTQIRPISPVISLSPWWGLWPSTNCKGQPSIATRRNYSETTPRSPSFPKHQWMPLTCWNNSTSLFLCYKLKHRAISSLFWFRSGRRPQPLWNWCQMPGAPVTTPRSHGLGGAELPRVSAVRCRAVHKYT